MADLLDVNVWLALAVEGHQHHPVAKDAWKNFDQPSFCRLTQLGLLRLLCNEKVMGKTVLRPYPAWLKYESLLRTGTIDFRREPSDLDSYLAEQSESGKGARDFWSDSYLAAFARAEGMRIVTFDKGYARFDGLLTLVLK